MTMGPRLGWTGWLAILDRWGVTMIATARDGDARLAAALSTDPGWRQAYADADGQLFVRTDRRS